MIALIKNQGDKPKKRNSRKKNQDQSKKMILVKKNTSQKINSTIDGLNELRVEFPDLSVKILSLAES